MTPTPTRSDQDIALAFFRALVGRDFDTLETLVAPGVWFRALLPRHVVEAHSLETAVEIVRSWFEDSVVFELVDSDHHRLGSRHQLRYRLRLRPDWAPDEWHEIEQTASVRVRDRKVARIDIVCTGFHPITDRKRGVDDEAET